MLSVPVGPDRVIWNLMRIYGRDRLARLIDGYDVVQRIGYDSTKLDEGPENVLRTYEPVLVLSVPDQICMQEAFWCHPFGHSVGSLLKGLAVALVVVSVARSLRVGKYRAAGAKLVINAIFFVVTAPDHGGPVVLFCLPVLHIYFQRPPRPRVVDFGPRVELR